MSLNISQVKINYNYWNWNGYKIAWFVENEKKNIPLLFLHGFGASSRHWRKNYKSFAQEGYAVYSIDLLGFGKSDQPGIKEIGKLDNGIWCDQVADFITDVIRPINSKEIVIVGNSLGGLVALTCAVSIPEEISGIVISPLPDPISLNLNDSENKPRLKSLKIKIIKFVVKLLPIEFILFVINRFGFINFFLKFAYEKKESIDKELINPNLFITNKINSIGSNFTKNLIILILRDFNFGLFSELLRLRLIGSGNGDITIPEISSGIEAAQVKAINPPRELPTITISLEFMGLITSVIKSET